MKFQIGRRYKWNGNEWECAHVFHDGNALFVLPGGENGWSLCRTRDDATELPPREGEFYRDEPCEISDDGVNWIPAVYMATVDDPRRPHVAYRTDCPRSYVFAACWAHCRRPLPKRRVPTDEDAKRRPRAWDHMGQEVVLVAVTPESKYPFAVRYDNVCVACVNKCEIEA